MQFNHKQDWENMKCKLNIFFFFLFVLDTSSLFYRSNEHVKKEKRCFQWQTIGLNTTSTTFVGGKLILCDLEQI